MMRSAYKSDGSLKETIIIGIKNRFEQFVESKGLGLKNIDFRSIEQIFEEMIINAESLNVIKLSNSRLSRIDSNKFICYDGTHLYVGDKFCKYDSNTQVMIFMAEWFNFMTSMKYAEHNRVPRFVELAIHDMGVYDYLHEDNYPNNNMRKVGTVIYNNCFKENSKGKVLCSTETIAKCEVNVRGLKAIPFNEDGTMGIKITDVSEIKLYDIRKNELVARDSEEYKKFMSDVEVFESLSNNK